MRAYWVTGTDISSPESLRAIFSETELAQATDAGTKKALRDTTVHAARRGAFGAPTFFVGDEMFFGNDRLDFVEAAAQELV